VAHDVDPIWYLHHAIYDVRAKLDRAKAYLDACHDGTEHKPKPRGSLAEDLGNNLQATQEQILSTLNAAERRIVERRFVIKPKRQEA